MAKVITFSRFFPSYHPKKGQPTYFVEKIWAHLILSEKFDWESCESYLCGFWCEGIFSMKKVEECVNTDALKIHTIREDSRWKVGDVFSPRVWSGKPYYSKQIVFAPELTITKTEKIGTVMYGDEMRFWKPYEGTDWAHRPDMKQTLSRLETETIAKNDGLLVDDFRAWFKKGFEGQIIHF